LIHNLLKVKLPFEPSTLAQAAGIAALADKEFLHKSLELNAAGMRFLTTSLREIGLQVVPSEANFLMVPLPSAEPLPGLPTSYSSKDHHPPLASFGLPNCRRIRRALPKTTSAVSKQYRN